MQLQLLRQALEKDKCDVVAKNPSSSVRPSKMPSVCVLQPCLAGPPTNCSAVPTAPLLHGAWPPACAGAGIGQTCAAACMYGGSANVTCLASGAWGNVSAGACAGEQDTVYACIRRVAVTRHGYNMQRASPLTGAAPTVSQQGVSYLGGIVSGPLPTCSLRRHCVKVFGMIARFILPCVMFKFDIARRSPNTLPSSPHSTPEQRLMAYQLWWCGYCLQLLSQLHVWRQC